MTSRTELKFQQRLKTKPVSSKINQKSDKDSKKISNSFELSEIISPQVDNTNDDSTNSDIEDISPPEKIDIVIPEFVNEKRIVEKAKINEEPIHIEVVCAKLIKKNTGTLGLFCYRCIVLIILFMFAFYLMQIISLLKSLQI